MSSTSTFVSSTSTSGGGGILPAPKFIFDGSTSVTTSLVLPDADRSLAPSGAATLLGVARCVATGIPKAIMDNPGVYDLRLDLLRYRPRAGTAASRGGDTKQAGYVHPSNAPSPSGNGSYTYGGAHSDVSASVVALRTTEWAITSPNQVIDVGQAMASWMSFRTMQWTDNLNTPQTISLVCPLLPRSKIFDYGNRFAYSGAYRPGYFKFRYSIKDVSDTRSQRIYGPDSEVVSLTTAVFPFVIDEAASVVFGRKVATLAPALDPSLLRVWINKSRLP